MQSIIAAFIGLIVSMAGLLITKGAIASGADPVWTGILGWLLSLWGGVFLTAFLCPKKNATWLKSRLPAWSVMGVILVIGALNYASAFKLHPLWVQFPLALAMSGGSLFLIWLAPKLSRRPTN